MLPFLKNKEKQQSAVMVKQRAPDQPEQEDDKSASHMACAQDLLKAIESKDIKGIAEALQSAFEIMDSEPHVEGEHVSPHSYDAQNEKAGQENR